MSGLDSSKIQIIFDFLLDFIKLSGGLWFAHIICFVPITKLNSVLWCRIEWWLRTTQSCQHKALLSRRGLNTIEKDLQAKGRLNALSQNPAQMEGACSTPRVIPKLIPSQGGWCQWCRIYCCGWGFYT